MHYLVRQCYVLNVGITGEHRLWTKHFRHDTYEPHVNFGLPELVDSDFAAEKPRAKATSSSSVVNPASFAAARTAFTKISIARGNEKDNLLLFRCGVFFVCFPRVLGAICFEFNDTILTQIQEKIEFLCNSHTS